MAKRWTKGMRESLRKVLVPNWAEVAVRLSESLGTHITPGAARKQWFRMQRHEGKKLLSALRAVERDYEAATEGLTEGMCARLEPEKEQSDDPLGAYGISMKCHKCKKEMAYIGTDNGLHGYECGACSVPGHTRTIKAIRF